VRYATKYIDLRACFTEILITSDGMLLNVRCATESVRFAPPSMATLKHQTNGSERHCDMQQIAE
jgi:hypothetical protein